MGRVREALRQLTATRYTRSLEAEVARLRVENRALLNSILGVAGIPPVTVLTDQTENERQFDAPGNKSSSGLDSAGVARLKGIGPRTGVRRVAPAGGAPLRRRSWHQINQALEIGSARTKERGIGRGTGNRYCEQESVKQKVR
ncbi:MAG TPA: hypothetical protein VMF66_10705 [Candidatus Acidoferrum sp.]|nr:hypothetical protein [Candidatus Acidoferrum sp.]